MKFLFVLFQCSSMISDFEDEILGLFKNEVSKKYIEADLCGNVAGIVLIYKS